MLLSRLRPRLVSSALIRTGVQSPSQPLTACDVLTRHTGVPFFYVYRQGLDVARLQRSVQAAATHHPGFTGRLQAQPDGQVALVGNDAGLSFKVWTCDGPVPDYGPHHPMHRDAFRYMRPILPWEPVRRQLPLVQIGVFQFADGASVLMVQAVHALLDARSMWHFLIDCSRLAQGLDVAGPVAGREWLFNLMQPLVDRPEPRQALQRPAWSERARLYPQLAWQAWQNRPGIYRVPAAAIDHWRQAVPAQAPAGLRPSTADLVTAHALKLLSAVQGHARPRTVGLVSDLRYRKALGLPPRMMGNALAHQSVDVGWDALQHQGEADLALTLRQAGAAHSHDDTLGYLGMLERHRRQRSMGQLMPASVVRAPHGGFMQNNYSHLPIYDVDLGTGPPQWFNPMPVPFRMLKITPTPSGDGSVDLHLTVSAAEQAPFAQRYGESVL